MGKSASLVTAPNRAPRLRERWLNQYSYRGRLSTSYPAWMWGKVEVMIGALTIALVEVVESAHDERDRHLRNGHEREGILELNPS